MAIGYFQLCIPVNTTCSSQIPDRINLQVKSANGIGGGFLRSRWKKGTVGGTVII